MLVSALTGCTPTQVSCLTGGEATADAGSSADGQRASDVQGEGEEADRVTVTQTVTVTVGADETGSVTNRQAGADKASRTRSKASQPSFGPEAGPALAPIGDTRSVFPVPKYEWYSNEAMITSSYLPSWMGKGRFVGDSRVEFSVDGIQLAMDVRDSPIKDKRAAFAARKNHWNDKVGAPVTYKAITRNGFVISGEKDGVVYYELFEVYENGEYFGSWVYPKSIEKQMDPVITRFYEGFQSGMSVADRKWKLAD